MHYHIYAENFKKANSAFNNSKKKKNGWTIVIYIYIYISTQNAYFLQLLSHRNNSLLLSGWKIRKGRFIAWIHLVRRREWYHNIENQNIENAHRDCFQSTKLFFLSAKVFTILRKYLLSEDFYAANFSPDILSTTQDFGLESHPLVFHPAHVPNNP